MEVSAQPNVVQTPTDATRKKFSWKNILLGVIIGAILIVVIGVTFWYLTRPKESATSPTTTTKTSTSSAKTATPSANENKTVGWKTYTNAGNHYAIDYSTDWSFREYPGTETGAGFKPLSKPNDVQYEYINIDFVGLPANNTDTPFEEFVKTAAMYEIQGFESLNSISKITTNSNLIGYETTWHVRSLDGKEFVSDPITYFPAAGNDNTHSIQVSSTGDYLDIYHQMIKTFHYVQ